MVIVTLMLIWSFAWPEFSDIASKRSFCHFSSRTLTCLSLSPRLSGMRTLTGIVWAGWLIDWSPFHQSAYLLHLAPRGRNLWRKPYAAATPRRTGRIPGL